MIRSDIKTFRHHRGHHINVNTNIPKINCKCINVITDNIYGTSNSLYYVVCILCGIFMIVTQNKRITLLNEFVNFFTVYLVQLEKFPFLINDN